MLDYNRMANEYALHRRTNPEVVRALCAGSALAHHPAQTCVLEVGCGTGNYIRALAETGARCLGVEPAAEMLARARASNARGITFYQGTVETLLTLEPATSAAMVPAGIFDLIFSVDVIHHVPDRARYFAAVAQLLKPGGWVCTVTDSTDDIRQRVPLSRYFPETVAVELQRYPTIAALLEWMRVADFVEEYVQSVTFSYPLTDLCPYREKAYSALHLIAEDAFQRGLAHLESDLSAGALAALSLYTLVWGRKPAAAPEEG